jgi:HD-GYP domain-containing protein (c-di-GMP phosphodiesterase class II)
MSKKNLPLSMLAEKRKESLESNVPNIISVFSFLIEAKDAYTARHCFNVAIYAKALARRLKLSTCVCEDIYLSGLLHDIGKISIPNEILHKKGLLNAEERLVIQKHVVMV